MLPDQIVDFVRYFLNVYLICMIVWALIGWLPMISPGLAFNSGVMSVRRFLDSIIMPWVKVFSGIKPVQLGSMLFDLSFLAAFFAVYLAARYLPGILSGL